MPTKRCISEREKREFTDLSQLYGKSYYYGGAYNDYTFPKLWKGFLSKIRIIKKFCGKGSRVLDVGCALGYFVKLALNEGFDAYGIDFSKYAIEEARKLVGNRVICADVEREIYHLKTTFLTLLQLGTCWNT